MNQKKPNAGAITAPIVRTQGCWNCKHWSLEAGKAFWSNARLRDLQIAAGRAAAHPHGESETQVVNIRRMVDTVDVGVAKGELGSCLKQDLQRDQPIGDLVAHAYLCTHWSGKQGASLAREGAKADKLPGELMEDLRADVNKGG